MGAWRYCSCEAPLPRPTVTDAIIGRVECKNCALFFELGEWERRSTLDEHWEEAKLFDDVTRIEKE